MRAAGLALLGGVALAVACGGKDDSGTAGVLPDLDTALSGGGTQFDTGFVYIDDTFAPGGTDEVPNNTLLIQHFGNWSLSPLGGPYRAVVGELLIEEWIDGDDATPWCWVIYSMTGEAVDAEDERAEGCDGCDFVFEVEFYVNQDGGLRPEDGAEPIDTGGMYDEDDVVETNGLEDCMSPDLPADGERWIMGYSSLEETVYLEYYGSGIWLPWYSGALEFDRVDFSWVEEFGFVVPPEEEED